MENKDKYDFTFVAHEGKVLCAKYNIPYWIIFPDYDCKQEYIQRMKDRGNSEAFIKKIADNYDNFVKGCYDDNTAERKILLHKGEYLKDVIERFYQKDNTLEEYL